MTPQERTMLSDFLGKLTSVRNITKDNEADSMIRQAMSAQPDAGYVLVQNMLLMQHTLTEMNARIAQLENQQAQPNTNNNSSFLGPQSQNAVKSYFGGSQPTSYAQQPQQQPVYGQPQQQSSGFGDFLRSAGTTAAGVAGGMLLFEGVSSLFGGGHGHGGFGGGYENTGNTTINNYYSEPSIDSGSSEFLGSSDVDSAFDSSFDTGSDDAF